MTKTIPKKTEPNGRDKERQAKNNPADFQLADGDAGERDSVDRIRDILFGAQVRQYEQKFSNLDETITKEVAKIQEATKKSVDALENFTKKQLESLNVQLKAEQKDRADSMRELSRTFENSNKNLEKKLSALDEKANIIQHDLQEQILHQSKTLMNEINQKHEEITAALKKAAEELRNEKIDRIALGNLFAEMGLRLKEEFKIPNVK